MKISQRINGLLCTTAAALTLGFTASAAGELVTGGDFDTSSGRAAWTTSSNGFAFSANTWQFRLTSATTNRTLSQQLTTALGQDYDFNFDFRFQGGASNAVAPSGSIEVIDVPTNAMLASAVYNAGTIGQTAPDDATFYDMPTIQFSALSDQTLIRFSGVTGLNGTNLAVDNISVVEGEIIPEPTTVAMAGLLGLALVGRRRAHA